MVDHNYSVIERLYKHRFRSSIWRVSIFIMKEWSREERKKQYVKPSFFIATVPTNIDPNIYGLKPFKISSGTVISAIAFYIQSLLQSKNCFGRSLR